jgi:hypothetical protein
MEDLLNPPEVVSPVAPAAEGTPVAAEGASKPGKEGELGAKKPPEGDEA